MARRQPTSYTGNKILILGTSSMILYQHRLELIQALIKNGFDVYVGSPEEDAHLLVDLGCSHHNLELETRGTNPLSDMRLLSHLVSYLRKLKPDIVLTFYTKTNVYGGIACRMTGTPYIENITGLGSALGNGGMKQKMMTFLYNEAVKNADLVYFQNKSNLRFFKEHKIHVPHYEMLPGSGVALERFAYLPFPDDKKIRFAFLGRIIIQKGFLEFIEAALKISKKYPNAEFHIIGPDSAKTSPLIQKVKNHPQFIYHGKVLDIRPIMQNIHCLVFPSYYPEGMANVLLESASMGRALITTSCPGCGETVDDSKTGFIVPPQNIDELVKAMEKFIAMPNTEKKAMGLKGRKKMEKEFDRKIVINSYLKNIRTILNPERDKSVDIDDKILSFNSSLSHK